MRVYGFLLASQSCARFTARVLYGGVEGHVTSSYLEVVVMNSRTSDRHCCTPDCAAWLDPAQRPFPSYRSPVPCAMSVRRYDLARSVLIVDDIVLVDRSEIDAFERTHAAAGSRAHGFVFK
jgi:hypothetical protein